MTREIKFRGFNTTNGTMIDMKPITPSVLYPGIPDGLFLPIADDIKLMQSTGIKDKNGVDIYEGDKVTFNTSFENYNDEYEYTRESPCMVSWEESCGGFWPFILNNRWRCDVENIEVVGNIYQTDLTPVS